VAPPHCRSSDLPRQKTANGSATYRQIGRYRNTPQGSGSHDGARSIAVRESDATKSSRLVAIARVRQNPRPVRALEVTAVAVIIIAVPAPFTLSGDGSPRPRPDDRTDGRTATSAERAPEEGPSASPDYGAAKYILSRRLMNRHHQSQTQHRRDSQISKHSVILHSVDGACWCPHCGRRYPAAAATTGPAQPSPALVWRPRQWPG
jgi:hypothetical protein